MDKKLKTYELELNADENAIVDFIALTANPAIESLALAFSKESETSKEDCIELKFDAVDEDEMILMGAAMIPDYPMVRNANSVINEKHYVKFSAQQIKDAEMIFMKNGFQNRLNIEHTSTNADAYIFETFFVDSSRGKFAPTGLGELPDGTWIITVKCESKEVFKAAKEVGAGFSVQGMFKYKFQSEISDDEKLTQTLLSELNTILKKIK